MTGDKIQSRNVHNLHFCMSVRTRSTHMTTNNGITKEMSSKETAYVIFLQLCTSKLRNRKEGKVLKRKEKNLKKVTRDHESTSMTVPR